MNRLEQHGRPVRGGWALSCLLLAARPGPAPAAAPLDDPTVASRVPSFETGLESDHLSGDWGGLRRRLWERGFHFQAGYTAEWMGNLAGGLRRGSVYQGLLELAVEADLERLGWTRGGFHASALYPHGNSLSESYVGDLSTVSSIAAYDSFRLFECWYEQKLGEASVRVGQLAADEEFATCAYGDVFMNSSFGWPNLATTDFPAPIYPVATLGLRVRAELTETIYVQAALYDGEPGAEQVNRHGVIWKWDDEEGLLVAGEVGWNGALAEHAGSYKLGAWVHTASFDHQHVDEQGRSLADPLSSGEPRQLSPTWALYAVAEQALWSEPETEGVQGLGIFLRAAGARPDRNFVQYYLESGLNYRGLLPGRDQDVLGLGAFWIGVSKETRALSRDFDRLGAANPDHLDYEVALELTYEARLRPWWTLQPDLQLVFQGDSGRDTAVVAGVRSTVIF